MLLIATIKCMLTRIKLFVFYGFNTIDIENAYHSYILISSTCAYEINNK